MRCTWPRSALGLEIRKQNRRQNCRGSMHAGKQGSEHEKTQKRENNDATIQCMAQCRRCQNQIVDGRATASFLGLCLAKALQAALVMFLYAFSIPASRSDAGFRTWVSDLERRPRMATCGNCGRANISLHAKFLQLRRKNPKALLY